MGTAAAAAAAEFDSVAGRHRASASDPTSDSLLRSLSNEEALLGFDMKLVSTCIVCPRSRPLGLVLESAALPGPDAPRGAHGSDDV